MTSITEFLTPFYPDSEEPICLRAFPPRGAKGEPRKLAVSRSRLLSDAALRAELSTINKTHGIYFVVNAGGDKDADIIRFNACFVESDTKSIEEQLAALDRAPIPPSILLVTKKSVHAYWLIAGDCTAEHWREVQVRLIAYFDGDAAIKNPSRVMRLPHFEHISADGSRKPVECVAFEPERRYTLAKLLDAFPPVPEEKEAKKRTPSSNRTGTFSTWGALLAELGRRIEAHESARRNDSGKIDCRGICHNGKGNTSLFFDPSTNKAICNKGCDQAAILRAFGLPEKPEFQAGTDQPRRTEGKEIELSQLPVWEPPIRFHEYRLPVFPVETLPKWLQGFCVEKAHETQTPVDLVAWYSLANCSAAIAGKYVIEPKTNWIEPVNIFTVTSLPPGNRKTAIYNATKAPLENYSQQKAVEAQPKIERMTIERDMLEKRLEELKKRAAKEDDREKRAKLTEEAKEIAEELRGLKVPATPRLFASGDITPETIPTLMAEQRGRLFINSDEGEFFEILAGRYSDKPNFEVVLKGHTGGTVQVDRRGRSELVEHATLTIGISLQPDVLHGLASGTGKQSMRGRGLLARWFYSLPLSLVGSRDSNPRPTSEAALRAYDRCLKTLAAAGEIGELGDKPLSLIVLKLSPEAYACLTAFMEFLEPKMGEDGELYGIADWLAKLAGGVARLAAILHLADYADAPSKAPIEIPVSTIRRAIKIGEYLIPHTQAAFAEMGLDPDVELAKRALRWIAKNRTEEEGVYYFRKQDLWQGVKGGIIKKAADLDKGLSILEDQLYIKPLISGGPKGGKVKVLFEVNPAVFNSTLLPNSPNAPNWLIDSDDLGGLGGLGARAEADSTVDSVGLVDAGTWDEGEL